jgi:hypothetical protein
VVCVGRLEHICFVRDNALNTFPTSIVEFVIVASNKGKKRRKMRETGKRMEKDGF